MSWLEWLFGKKSAAPAGGACCSAHEANGATLKKMSENLRRWRQSSEPRAWIAQHGGAWNHEDWLELLEGLKKTPYWPMDPAEVGQVLEEVKTKS